MNSTTAHSAKSTRGQSQWAIIWREFCKRRMAVAASVVILFLVTVSIFAPILANAAPIYYFGFNRFEYQEAGRNLRATLSQLIESRTKNPQSEASVGFLKSIPLQIEIMVHGLPTEKATELQSIGQKLLEAAKSTDISKSNDEISQLRRKIQTEFDAKQVNLVSKTHWPALETLTGLELFLMLTNLLFLLFPTWNFLISRGISPDRDLLRNWIRLLIGLGIPLLCATGWWLVVPNRVDRSVYKKGMLAADDVDGKAPVVFQSVIWPPIAYGLDEFDLNELSIPPAFYPQDKDAVKVKPASPWSGPHWLGTDKSGRDVLCRMIWGGRVSLSVGLVAVAIYVSIGIVVGAVAGYFRGICDLIISRLIEVMICFPTFFLILTIVAFLGPSLLNIMIIIGLTGWTGIARLVRGEFLRLVDQEFVLAGRALGYSPARLIFRHILPNAMAPVLVSATFGIAGGILTESALSFLGLGVSKPTPSWGAMLLDGREALQSAPWLIHFPGIAIFLVITAYNLMGEALRDAADPRLRGAR